MRLLVFCGLPINLIFMYMQFWCFLFACVSCHDFVSYSETKGTQTKGNRAVSVVQDSLGTDLCIYDSTTLDFANSTRASFQGSFVSEPCASGSSFSQDVEFATKLVRRKGDEPGLDLLPLQANEQKACRVLPVLWHALGAGYRQSAVGWCRWRYSTSEKRMELANLGRLGRHPKGTEVILQGEKCICKKAEQGQRKREGSIQGQDGTVVGISFHCDADYARRSPFHSFPATEHSAINYAGGQQFQHRADDGHQKGVPRLSVDAFRIEGCDGEVRISGNEDAHPRTPSSNDFNGEGAEGLQGASRRQRASQIAVAATHGDFFEGMETTNGGVRQEAAGFRRGHPKSKERHGRLACSDTEPQCESCWQASSPATSRDDRDRWPRRLESHCRQGGKEIEAKSSTHPCRVCHQVGHQDNDGRVHHCIGRRKARQRELHQKTKIQVAKSLGVWCCWYLTGASRYMTMGSALSCLRKTEHLPRTGKSVRFDVPAYHLDCPYSNGAANYQSTPLDCQTDLLGYSHPVVFDENYVNPWAAQLHAMELAAECIEEEAQKVVERCSESLQSHVFDRWCIVGQQIVGNHDHRPIYNQPYSKTRLLDQRHSDTALPGDEHLPEEHVAEERATLGDPLLAVDDLEYLNYLLDSLREARASEITLVSFGLYATSVGTRRATSPPDETSIRAAVLEMWADYFVGEAYAVLHMVRPQEFLANVEIHFIIEFGNRALPLPRGDIPILRRTTWHEVWHDAEPVASYVSQRLSPQEVINQCGLSEWCNVHTRTTCNLHVEKRICLPLVRVQLSPGSLVEIFIHFNPVEEEDETSLFQPLADASHATHHDSINCRTWPEPNEELQRLLHEAEEAEPDIAEPIVGPVVFDDPNEWTRLAVAFEQPAPAQLQVVVHGLLYEEVGVRRLFLPSFSIRLMEEMIQGLWPELDYLNKVIYLVSPQPLQGHLEEVTVILEFYDPWLARDFSIKPILLECLQPGLDDIHRIAKYCPERVTKGSFPIEPSGCPVEGSTLSVQIWIQDTPLQLHQVSVVQAGNLVTLRYTAQAESIEDWIQHLFPGAQDYKMSTSNATALELIRTTSWTFLEKVQPGEPSRHHTRHPPWLRFHDPYFVVQAFLEMMTHQQTEYDNYRIYEVPGSSRTQMTFLCGEPRNQHCLIQVSFSAKWDDTWSETFCYQVRERVATREFLRTINLERADVTIFREGRPFHDDVAHFRNGDLVEIEFEQCSEENTTTSSEDAQGHDEVSALQQHNQVSLTNDDFRPIGRMCKPNPNLGIDFDDDLPYRRRVVNGETTIVRDVPPPNWAELPIYMVASSLQAVARDASGHLYVHYRTWLLHHNRDSPVTHRDGRIRAQLMVDLHSHIRRLWREHIDPDDDIKTTVVRPNPVLNRNEGPMLLLLVECNRPLGSPTRPILLTFQEIDARGPDPERLFRAYLAPPTINLQYLAERCECEPHHVIAPLGTEDRRWIGRDQSRPVVSGRYIPIWFDLRRPPFSRTEPVDGAGTIVEDDSSLMQRGGGRECSRSPRRAEDATPLSTQSSSTHLLVHAFRLSREHRALPLDRASSQSFSEQVRRQWAAPERHGYTDLHIVSSPPTYLDSTADGTYIVEFAVDRQRQADPADRLILVDIKIQEDNPTVAGSHIRRVLWSRGFMMREDMLHLLASAGLCKLTTIQCTLNVNHNPWPVGDGVRRQMLHGDFVQLNVEGPEAVPSSHIQVALCEQEAADSQRFIYHASPTPSPEPSAPVEIEDGTDGHGSDQEIPAIESNEEEGGSPSHSISMLQYQVRIQSISPKGSDKTITCSGGAEPRATPETPHVSDLWCGDQGEYAYSSPPDNHSNRIKKHDAKGPERKDETALPRRPLGDITNVPGAPRHRIIESGHDTKAVDQGSKMVDSRCEAVFSPAPRRVPIAIAPYLHPVDCEAATVPLSVSTQELAEILLQWEGIHPGCYAEEAAALELTDEVRGMIQNSDQGKAFNHFHLFTDGSYNSEGGVASWSFVIVSMDTENYSTDSRCRLVGYYTGNVTSNYVDDFWHGAPHLNAYIAELEALFHAHWWALCNNLPCVHIHYDAMSAGQASAGAWGFAGGNCLATCTRALAQALDEVAQHPTTYHHVRAHSGDPWNELADATAKATLTGDIAPRNPFLFRWHSWITGQLQLRIESLPTRLALLKGDRSLPECQGQSLSWMPLLAEPTPDALWALGKADPPPVSGSKEVHTTLKCCTFNVRTLKEDPLRPQQEHASF